MKLIRLVICIPILLIFLSCNNQEKYKTDIELLKSYINLPREPEEVRYEIIEEKLRAGSQDCSKLTSVVGVLRFSDKDFKFIVENLKKAAAYDTELAKDDEFYREWYSSSIKEIFSKDEITNNNRITTIYSGGIFKKENFKGEGGGRCFITNNNEIIVKFGYCEGG
jgi:hypothetical protein